MLWILQDNLHNEYGYIDLIDILKKFNIPHMEIKPVPFSYSFVEANFDSFEKDLTEATEPFIDNNQSIMVCGSNTLSRIAKNRDWKPGTFLNENFEFSQWKKGFGKENLLNDDAIVGTIQNIDLSSFEDSNQIFARPIYDNKAFAGGIMPLGGFKQWLDTIKDINPSDEFNILHKNTEIVVSHVKHIISEYRFFVVDGQVVSGSLYKHLGNIKHQREFKESFAWQFAQKSVDFWQPIESFVIDIAETLNGFKIIEINNLNSAGFYDCDIEKIVISLEKAYN